LCDPVSLAAGSLAIGTASAFASYSAQSAQAAAVKQQNNAITASAIQNQENQYQQGQETLVGTNAAASQKQQQMQLNTRSAEATALTSAGENGVGGNSVAAIVNEYNGNAARYMADVNTNTNMTDQEIMSQMAGVQANAQSTINREAVPVPPSALGLGLAIGGDAMNSYRTYQQDVKARLAAKTQQGA
jgi:hypothetical protein